jgi:hypothetical protein
MAKTGMSEEAHIRGLLKAAAGKGGWALCVGAGISASAFPDWDELVSRLAARDDAFPPSADALRKLQVEYSPDALIQAAKDRLRLTEEAFASVLAEELYSNVLAMLPKDRQFGKAV